LRVVLLSISLDDEGLASCTSQQEIEELQQSFCEGVLLLVFMLRGKMHSEARLALGGPYPNGAYSDIHLRALERTRDAMVLWEDVDAFVDFLKPGLGRWAEGCTADTGNPNNVGHEMMFQCIDLGSLLGTTVTCAMECSK